MKFFIYLGFLPLLLLFVQACSTQNKAAVFKEELREELNASKNPLLQKPAIEIVEVTAENFHISKLDVPDRETIEQVKIMGAQLHDVIALLTEATDQDIIFQLQSEAINPFGQNPLGANLGTAIPGNTDRNLGVGGNLGIGGSLGMGINNMINNDERQIRQSKVYVSASGIGFGRLLTKAVGNKLSVRYNEGSYYLGHVKTVTVKIPALKGLVDVLKTELQTLGALNVIHDAISSSVTFSAREKEYGDIMTYLEILRNNLYVIEYDIAIYNVELKDNYSMGINWNLIPKLDSTLGFVSSTSSAVGTGIVGAPSATFGAIVNSNSYSGNMIADVLTHFGKVESIQRPKLLGVAGTDVILVDGLEEPYIKELTTTAVGERGIQTSTVSGTALSGLKITLNSNIMDETVLTDIALEINDIVGYSDFEVDGVKYSQPRTLTKNIQNSMRVQPGIPIVISGLFRHKSDKGYKGIPGIAQTNARLLGGSEFTGVTKSEMVIIVTPRVIKYVIK